MDIRFLVNKPAILEIHQIQFWIMLPANKDSVHICAFHVQLRLLAIMYVCVCILLKGMMGCLLHYS